MCCEKEKKEFFEAWEVWEDAWMHIESFRAAATIVGTNSQGSIEVDGSEYQRAIEAEEKAFQAYRQKQNEYWECVQQCREQRAKG